MAISLRPRINNKRSPCFTGQPVEVKYSLAAYIHRMKHQMGNFCSISVIYQLGIPCTYPDWEANYLFWPPSTLVSWVPRLRIYAIWLVSASLSCLLFSIELTFMGIVQNNLESEAQNYSLRHSLNIWVFPLCQALV